MNMETLIGSQEKEQLSLDEAPALLEKIIYHREEKARIEAERKANNALLESFNIQLSTLLEEKGLEKFSTKAGTFQYGMKTTYLVPKEENQKQEFFDYLKQRGVFESLISVNSRTLQAWAKSEEEVFTQNAEYDKTIPGIVYGEPVRTYKFIAKKN